MEKVDSLLDESASGLSELLHKFTREAVEARTKDLKEKLAGKLNDATCLLEAQVAELTQAIAILTAEGSQQRDRQLEMALQESTENSRLRQKVPDEAAKDQFPALFIAHLRNIATDGELTKYYSSEDVNVLKSAADMAMSTSNDFLAARDEENAAVAVEETPIEWALSHTHTVCEGLTQVKLVRTS